MYTARLTELLEQVNTNLSAIALRTTPFTLTFSDDDNSTLACALIREHGDTLDLASAVTLATGATVFAGDVIEFTATGEDGYDPAVTVNAAAVELDESGKYTMTVAGNVVAACVGEAQ